MSNRGGCACASGPPPPNIPSIPRGAAYPSQAPPNIPQINAEPRGSTRVSKQNLETFSQITGGQAERPSEKETATSPDGPRGSLDSGASKLSAMSGTSTGSKKKPGSGKWVSPLRRFDVFALDELRKREIAIEDFPKLTVPTVKGLHRCRVQSLSYHQVDTSVELDQELRSIGIQQTLMLEQLEKLTKAEAACRFQGAVRAAEIAAMAAPPELAEEAAVAGARGYTVETKEFSKKVTSGENPVEIIGYIGCTRPNNF